MRCRNDVYPQNPGMNYPKKEYAQCVCPAHILFLDFLVPNFQLGTDIKNLVSVIIK
jgi:hypothetical protein